MSSPLKENNRRIAWRITVGGRVQGVGFRPSVYRAARDAGVCGAIANTARGVSIEIEGTPRRTRNFFVLMKEYLPPQASVTRMVKTPITPRGYRAFAIRQSRPGKTVSAEFPPDLSICPDCLRELFDPGDRRAGYPFINCTNCGPRFSIVKELPYDRPKTTMRDFRMCPSCRREYVDPGDRRFHAQPNACPECGPRVSLTDGRRTLAADADAIRQTVSRLCNGAIIAIKGLGGYHLACDGEDAEAIRLLRLRKDRPHKPLAVMLPDIAAINEICEISSYEEGLLASPARPIVLLQKRKDIRRLLPTAELLAPGNACLGIMLPYTPLHYLLFAHLAEHGSRVLVMTSGNRRDEPLCHTEQDAYAKLGAIADAFLVHDRPIHNRCDDSILQAVPGKRECLFIRRSRGFVPEPVRLARTAKKSVFAAGAQLKNTFCIVRGANAYLSPYIGELDNDESLAFYRQALERYEKFLAVKPEVVARDLHPDYLSTGFAETYALRHRVHGSVPVQHHLAHMASVLAEKRISRPAIGFSFDGTGYGSDGAVWGSECFLFDGHSFERRGHFAYFSLPGGDTATKEIWRIALSLLHHAGINDLPQPLRRGKPVRAVMTMIDKGINCPQCSSAGRLFDGIAALVGLKDRVTFEAQAAIELESAATEILAFDGAELSSRQLDKILKKVYNFNINPDNSASNCRPMLVITLDRLIREIVHDLRNGTPVPVISARFHSTLAAMIARVALELRSEGSINDVVLSGGVFQNRLLLSLAVKRLEAEGFLVHYNTMVPPNDGGISLGQAWCALQGTKGKV